MRKNGCFEGNLMMICVYNSYKILFNCSKCFFLLVLYVMFLLYCFYYCYIIRIIFIYIFLKIINVLE